MSTSTGKCKTQPKGKRTDAAARERLILDHLPLVKHVLSRMAAHLPAHVDREDLHENGMLGLINAADRFDPERKVQFHTYAITRIRGAMVDSLRSQDWLPRSVRDELSRINSAREEIEQRTQRPASGEEIRRHANMGARKLTKLTRMSENCNFCSLHDLPSATLDEVRGKRSSPYNELPDGRAMLEEQKERLAAAMANLTKTERLVISLYYFEQLSLRAIAGLLHVTDSRVCQIHRATLARLERALRERAPSFELVSASA